MNTKKYNKWLGIGMVCAAFFFCISFKANAQIVLPKDEAGKITYLDVVKIDSVARDTIFKRILGWTKFTFPTGKLSIDSITQKISTRGRFLVYTKPGVLKEIHGAIRYDMAIEVKEGRYRYIFTNFVFEYYHQDRFYKYVPSGKEKALEEEKFPGWQAPWNKHKYTTDAHVKEKIADLKKAVENKKMETRVLPAVQKSKDW